MVWNRFCISSKICHLQQLYYLVNDSLSSCGSELHILIRRTTTWILFLHRLPVPFPPSLCHSLIYLLFTCPYLLVPLLTFLTPHICMPTVTLNPCCMSWDTLTRMVQGAPAATTWELQSSTMKTLFALHRDTLLNCWPLDHRWALWRWWAQSGDWRCQIALTDEGN